MHGDLEPPTKEKMAATQPVQATELATANPPTTEHHHSCSVQAHDRPIPGRQSSRGPFTPNTGTVARDRERVCVLGCAFADVAGEQGLATCDPDRQSVNTMKPLAEATAKAPKAP
jgi:hypothetical protein